MKHVQVLCIIDQNPNSRFPRLLFSRVALLLANIRIPEKDTDILLTVNTPVEVSPESSIAELGDAPLRAAGEARALFFHALKTFKINDWGLFG